jgi:hypothetical protein
MPIIWGTFQFQLVDLADLLVGLLAFLLPSGAFIRVCSSLPTPEALSARVVRLSMPASCLRT